MYDPRGWFYISRGQGTKLMIQLIEKCGCPSLSNPELAAALPKGIAP